MRRPRSTTPPPSPLDTASESRQPGRSPDKPAVRLAGTAGQTSASTEVTPAQARVVGLRAWLSLFSSTNTSVPRMAYSSSRRTHSCSSAAGRTRAGRAPGLSVTSTESRARWRAARCAGGRRRSPAARRLRVAGRHAQAVGTTGFAQRRPDRAQLLGGGVNAAELLGQDEGPLSLSVVGEEAAGQPAQLGCDCPRPRRRSALGSERVLS
jgi:hypothetical protein